MSSEGGPKFRATRRGFFAASAGAVAAAGITGAEANVAARALRKTLPGEHTTNSEIEPFWGVHQSGILTPAQKHTYFAAFDLTTAKRADVISLLQRWTEAAARLCAGGTAGPLPADAAAPAPDSCDVLELQPSRLTITFGFGPGLFAKDGKDRYGLAARRPEPLAALPKFPGDQLVEAKSGGDLSVQACAEDAQVAFHAVRQLAKLAYGSAEPRWAQSGFIGGFGSATPRNLLGFKDGTGNPVSTDPAAMNEVVWVGEEGPDWMRGGSYVVARRSRMALEHWDMTKVGFQEQTFGRQKISGAPLGKTREAEPLDLNAVDRDGNPLTPENAHVRLATAASNDGAKVLRRSYSYNDGMNFVAERWPPWKQAMEYDAGLLFVCYQRDPRTGFIKINEKLAKFDMMNQFVTVNGSALFACPGGIAKGEFIGQKLFAKA